jgi:fructosamine-3-kinase
MNGVTPAVPAASGLAAAPLPRQALEFLVEHGLADVDETPSATPLTGGVSSELWRVDLRRRPVCVKGALARLKVAADWQAPISRNTVEWNWLRFAAEVAPRNVPRPLAHDPGRGLLAMTYLDAATHPVWKHRLMAGAVDPDEAGAVGDLIGLLHANSAARPDLAALFATDDNFEQLRIAPYLRSLHEHHPDLGPVIDGIIEATIANRRAVVHGDLSPKNTLVGPEGPVLLDAECGWFGDPAFDLAFLLNHLTLKTLVVPRTGEFIRCVEAITARYARHVDWEPLAEVLSRTARLLPALLLARVDGHSPVEYLTDSHRSRVRQCARSLLKGAPARDPRDVVGAAITAIALP